MHRLEFKEPIFHRGLNYTVRVGEIKFSEGEIVEIEGREAVITEVLYTSLGFIPKRVYNFEHDPACHTPVGLVVALAKYYSDFDHVTCIGFVFLGE